MAADLRLEQYVQRKRRGPREYFYFRIVRAGVEIRIPLPHPFEADYRAAYDGAHRQTFGFAPGEFDSPTGISMLIRDHRASEKYRRLPDQSKKLRDYALELMEARWGAFEAPAIRPIHVQALYDSLAERPATANRRLDDISSVFTWGRTRGFADANPCHRNERVQSADAYEPWPDDAVKTLNPVVLAIAETERAARRAAGLVDPRRPLLVNSRAHHGPAQAMARHGARN